jgi:hypothetical protein
MSRILVLYVSCDSPGRPTAPIGHRIYMYIYTGRVGRVCVTM